MSGSLVGKSTVNIVWIADDEPAADALRNFFPMHLEHMKQHAKDGHLKLLQYSISESPEWGGMNEFFEGKFPPKTDRTIFNLFEIYETEDGLHQHYIDGKDFGPHLVAITEDFNVEMLHFNQMKVIQSIEN